MQKYKGELQLKPLMFVLAMLLKMNYFIYMCLNKSKRLNVELFLYYCSL